MFLLHVVASAAAVVGTTLVIVFATFVVVATAAVIGTASVVIVETNRFIRTIE